MGTPETDRHQEWDAAVAARLAKLRASPVDTASLERALSNEIGLGGTGTRSRSWWANAMRPTRAIAASLALIASIVTAVMLTASSGPAYAEAGRMAAMHRDITGPNSSVVRVTSVEAAERALSERWPGSPDLPDVPAEHVMACCLRSIDDRKLACVLLDDAGVPVSMMVAKATDVTGGRAATTVVRDNVSYQVQQSGELNMVMSQRDGRWVCLVGARPVARLIELSSSLQP